MPEVAVVIHGATGPRVWLGGRAQAEKPVPFPGAPNWLLNISTWMAWAPQA